MFRALSCLVVVSVVTLAAVMAGCAGSPSPGPPPISVNLSPASAQAIDQGDAVSITAQVMNDTDIRGVTWTLTGPGSLSNVTSSSVTYNPPMAALASGQQAMVKAASTADPSKTASVQITVNPYLQIAPSQTLPNGSVGSPYNQTIALIGGTSPFQWSVYNGPIITGFEVGGAVPDGMKLDAGTGTISGTPTAAGTWYFEMTVTDATGAGAIDGFLSIQINPTAATGNPIPFLNQTLVPTAVPPGSPGFTLSVSGSGFSSGATVDWNGSALPTTFVDTDHLTAMIPAANVASAGTATVTVVNAAPGGGRSNVVYFRVGVPEATVTFANAANSPIQIYLPLGITAADFNEDGKPDLAVAANSRVYVMLGNGDGTFATAAGSPMRLLSPPYDDLGSPYSGPLAVGDFNHSGHLGVAVGMEQSEAAEILLGHGGGTLTPSSADFVELGFGLSALVTADLNRDGNLDLASETLVALGYGDGAFSPPSNLDTAGLPETVSLGDINGDGKLDAVVTSGGSKVYPDSGLTILLGNGDGSFTPTPSSPIPLGSSLSTVALADFNGDGKLDVAVTDSGSDTVMILLGNGDGTFGAPLTIPVGNAPGAILSADFNNDGKMDLAVANYGDGTVTLLLGNGDGTFTPASGSPYAVGQNPYAITAADFNGDGKLDLAVANLGGSGSVSILLQQ